jgi:hypothetical protein
VRALAGDAHLGRQIAGADVQDVDAVHGGDGVSVLTVTVI